MNETDHLERGLATPDVATLGHPDLRSIHRQGRRRRRTRQGLAVGGGIAAAALVAGAGVAGAHLLDGSDAVQVATEPGAAEPTPSQPSSLAKRALREVPGAAKVSDWQIVLPAPAAHPEGDETLAPEQVTGATVDLGAHTYEGVTMWDRGQWPGWLHDGVSDWEHAAGDKNGYPVGSTDMGILADTGSAELACLTPWDWNTDTRLPGACHPAVVTRRTDGSLTLEWGMGTDRFLTEGSRMELFTLQDYSDDEPATVWIGGADGTGVERVEYVLTDGSTQRATVLPGTLVPGETMFFGEVTGDLAKVVSYDASGAVVEEHEVRPCDDPVDCEVR